MAEDSSEKTEQKSKKKWEQARDRGELPRSQDVATLIIFCTIIIYFSMVRIGWFEQFGAVMIDFLNFDRHLDLNLQSLKEFLLRPFLKTVLILAPFFGIVLVVSVVANMGQTGFSLATDKIKIDPNRLDPTKGIKKIFSLKSSMEGVKSVFKIVLFVAVAFYTLRGAIPDLIELPAHGLRHQLGYMVTLVLSLATRIAMLMIVLSGGDYAFQWWQFQEQLKMTHREAKDEQKEHEGDPLIRQRMRSLRMEMARKRMMQEVQNAQVVVTNPTHYAVALRYDQEKMAAPYVCAKGSQYLALRIREIAIEHGIPIIEHPPIARALFRNVKVGGAVPSDFYRVIAELLAYVFFLKKRRGSSPIRSSEPLRPRLKSALPAAALRELNPQ